MRKMLDGFLDSEIVRRPDIQQRHERLNEVMENMIIPRIRSHISDEHQTTSPQQLSQFDIVHLSKLVVGPQTEEASDFIASLRSRGVEMETLFSDLLEPTARYLGELWDQDECDFVDVTVGLGRLQMLLATFNCTIELPNLNERRKVLLTTMPNEQHSFGVMMVEKFLRAGGWDVRSLRVSSPRELVEAVRSEWFAVAGVALSTREQIGQLRGIVRDLRLHSLNPHIGIMVGGKIVTEHANIISNVGADATAESAPSAVLLAQKLFDLGEAKAAAASK